MLPTVILYDFTIVNPPLPDPNGYTESGSCVYCIIQIITGYTGSCVYCIIRIIIYIV